ncbi:multidrug resistance efflux transporter family protein [Oceanobacillus bengalensis]|uniref:Multidrug resistance efflux transporter family protein n=1 Tax=Oceanobacillus bengalensis TaxID=1435466 RepID=A0A494Z801_9BACI|nr:multidrug resistance efflux transporter family protein [Oceanobacillus bengalensis]RKQ18724.1 multidrug resistance efflux transporter family protein [Oceanobacillus bengalensis]
MRAIIIGLLGALFFSVTFVLNRSMELEGGSWAWSASLRFIFMLPLLFIIVGYKRNIKPVFLHLKKYPTAWLLWSTVGFGLFYAPLTFATIYGPGWLVAATFQLTIVAGSLIVPFLNKNNDRQSIPFRSIIISLIILAGVCVMQIEHMSSIPLISVILCVIPIIISSFAYPLGNRKMMQVVKADLNTFQRILGMTIASMPFWIILSIYGLVTDGLPSASQISQTFIVAVSSGIIATGLFFYATELVRNDNQKLAGVEATQSGEVIFALIGEILFLSIPMPSIVSFIGILLVIIGMILHSIVSPYSTSTKAPLIKHASGND